MRTPLLVLLLWSATALGQGTVPPLSAPLPFVPSADQPHHRAESADGFSYRAGGRFLLDVHLSVGVEPHLPSADSGLPIGIPVAFGIGGQALWRGLVGVGLSLYSSEGVALTAAYKAPGLADRVSATASLALRPFAPLAWREYHRDRRLSQFLEGIGIEVGPSLEYFRSASLPNPSCADIPEDAVKAAFHMALSVEAPITGTGSSGWLALRATARLIVSSDAQLAPMTVGPEKTCTAQVVERGVASQLFIGLAYYL